MRSVAAEWFNGSHDINRLQYARYARSVHMHKGSPKRWAAVAGVI